MSYIDIIDKTLIPAVKKEWTVLDLFAGCGGLALGFESLGFDTMGFEMNGDCCRSYNSNLSGKCIEDRLTEEYSFPPADIVIGGPPCQPFSVGGKQMGINDARNGFPSFISAIRQVKPKLWLFENVRGLLYRNKWYLEQVLDSLEAVGYRVEYHIMNAVNYFVPQNRERLVVVGHLGGFVFPGKSNRIITAGEALGDMALETPTESKFLTPNMDEYILKYERASKCINPRDLHMDKPARTLTCRNICGATGDMHRIKLSDGRRRQITVREAAVLQSFPSWFSFSGSESSQFNQIGNAVPPMLSRAIAASVKDYLLGFATRQKCEQAGIPSRQLKLFRESVYE